MKKFFQQTYAVLLILSLQSCLLDPKQESETQEASPLINLNVPEGFSFATSLPMNLDLDIQLLGGEPFSGGVFDVFLEKPENFSDEQDLSKYKLVGTINLDKNGKYKGQLKVPSYQTNLYLFSRTGGINPLLVVPKTPTGFSLTYIPQTAERSSNSPSSYMRTLANPTTLGTWNSVGYPNYLSENTFVSSGLLRRSRAILSPNTEIATDKRGLPDGNGEYNTLIKLDLESNQTATVDITFLFSLAANANSLGYYWFPSDSPPATAAEVTNKRMIFPNTKTTSTPNSGMVAGETVRLIGPNENGSFPDNTSIGFFLIQNAFQAGNSGAQGTINYNRVTFFSQSGLNSSPGDEQRFVNIYDAETNTIVFGVEDGGISSSSWSTRDNDFDDVVFFASYTPDDAVDRKDIPTTDPDPDPESDDLIYIPNANGFGTLMFDDSWPTLGDGDFNDLVVDYQFTARASATEVENNDRYVSQMSFRFKVAMADAANSNGFGVMIPGISPSSVSGISNLDIHGELNYNSDISISYQLEPGHTDEVVLLVAPEINSLFDGPCFNSGSPGCQTGSYIEFSFTLTFNPMARQSNFNSISAFMILNQNRGRELHTPGNKPSSLISESLYGSSDDGTDKSNGKYFQSKMNLPWGLDINSSIPVPKNEVSILDAYPNFESWAKSGGIVDSDWYKDLPGKRNKNKLIDRP